MSRRPYDENDRFDDWNSYDQTDEFYDDPDVSYGRDDYGRREERSYDYDAEDRRVRQERRRVRKARREAEIRRRKRQMLITLAAGIGAAAVLVILVMFVRRMMAADTSSGDLAASGYAEDTETSAADGADVSDAEGSAEDGPGEDGESDVQVASDGSGDEDDAEDAEDTADAAALLYSYYETANTIMLSDSLTDISIYDAQRHITSTTSTDDTESQDDAVYGDSSDEASAEDSSAEDEQTANDDDYIDSQYVIVVNADTGEIIAERNAFEQIIPASMTKVMTLLVAIEAMEDYEAALTDTFTITQEITDAAYLSGSSFVGYGVGDVATVEDLLYGTILPSGADAAMALAEYTAGTQEAFVEMMNEKAEELGLSATTHFTNVIGLYDDGENYSTPYDMCVIMNAAIDNEYCQAILSQRTWTTQAIMDNPDGTTISNWFLRRAEDHIDNWEILCGKTGFVNESGNCAVSYMKSSVTGTNYIACTALTYSSWRCIFDHAAIYNYLTE